MDQGKLKKLRDVLKSSRKRVSKAAQLLRVADKARQQHDYDEGTRNNVSHKMTDWVKGPHIMKDYGNFAAMSAANSSNPKTAIAAAALLTVGHAHSTLRTVKNVLALRRKKKMPYTRSTVAPFEDEPKDKK